MNLRTLFPLTSVAVVSLLLTMPGCDTSGTGSGAAATAGTEQVDDHAQDGDHSHTEDGDHAVADADADKLTKALASLSEEDRASALQQKICPVSDEPLGSMGAPKKVDVNGQAVWICCDGCRDKLLAEPDTYLAKLAPAQEE